MYVRTSLQNLPSELYSATTRSSKTRLSITAFPQQWMVSNETRRRHNLAPYYVTRPYGTPIHPEAFGTNRPLAPPNENTEHFNINNWNYAPPPPAYNVPHQAPPGYFKEEGKGGATVGVQERVGEGSGARGEQWGEYEAPVGPPPARTYGGGPVYR